MNESLENEDKPLGAKGLDDPSTSIQTESLIDDLKQGQNDKEVEQPDLEETKQAADDLEESFQIPKEYNRLTKKQLAEKLLDTSDKLSKVEHRASKVGHELGEMRSAYDDFIKSQMEAAKPSEKTPPIEFDDFVENTQGTLNRGISESPKVLELEKQLNDLRKQSAMTDFQNKHPDWTEISQTENFREFVRGNENLYRLAYQAQSQEDYAAADTLASLYKYAANTQKVAKQEARNEDLKKATTESGSTGSVPAKRWKKSEIQRLMQYDRPTYNAHMKEIAQAYQKGEVVDDVNVF